MGTLRAPLERAFLLGVAALQLAACDLLVGLGEPLKPPSVIGDAGANPDVSVSTPALAPPGAAQRLGLVRVNEAASGVLLADDLAITCGHCIHWNRTNFVVLEGSDAGASTSDQLYWFGVGAGNNPDLALLHLSTPLAGATPDGGVSLDVRPSGQRLGAPLTGYEWRAGAAGIGQWWTGGASVTAAKLYQLTVQSPPPPWQDDDGAPYFDPRGGSAPLTLVGLQTGQAGLAGTAVALGDMAPWIAAVRAFGWNADLTAQRVEVSWDEVATSYWSFTDVGAVTWAWAMRTATWFTYARGFPGGFFTGEQDAAGVVLECEGPGVVFDDALADEIATTPEPFIQVDAVPWAQANRDAAYLCRKKGAPGGHFDGNQVPSMEGTRYGLICANPSAVGVAIRTADLAAMGIASVDHADWTTAGRVGNAICRSQGFVSGFLTGESDADAGTSGVLCEN
jgi:hypothetical protein